jgi:hypothetical protein
MLLLLLLLLIHEVSLPWTPELALPLAWIRTVLPLIAEISLSLLRSVWAEIRIISV